MNDARRPGATGPSASPTPGVAPDSAAPAAPEPTPAELALHNNFVESARVMRRGFARTLYYLLAIREGMVYRVLGFDSLAAYAEHHAGLSARTLAEMLTLARRLRRSPHLADAVESGALSWRKALAISREALHDDPRPLIELAGDLSMRQLKSLLAGGEVPRPVVPSATEEGAGGRRDRGRSEAGEAGESGEASHGELFAATSPPGHEVARGGGAVGPDARVPDLEPSPDTGDAGRRGRRRSLIRGEHSSSPQYVTLELSPEQYARWEALTASIADRVGAVLDALAGGQRPPGPPFELVILHCPSCQGTALVTSRGELPAPEPLLGRARCDSFSVEDDGARRATIAPRVRRAALRRARYRCEAAGCGNSRWLEVHHRVPVSAHGGNELDNLVVLCGRCHRRLHERERSLRDVIRNEPGD